MSLRDGISHFSQSYAALYIIFLYFSRMKSAKSQRIGFDSSARNICFSRICVKRGTSLRFVPHFKLVEIDLLSRTCIKIVLISKMQH